MRTTSVVALNNIPIKTIQIWRKIQLLSIKTWWGYWMFINAAYSRMLSPKAFVQPHWRVSHRVRWAWIFGKKLWNLQVRWMLVMIWSEQEMIEMWRRRACFHRVFLFKLLQQDPDPIKTHHHPSPFISWISIQVLPYWSLPVRWVLLVHGLMVFSSFVADLQLIHRHYVLPWRSVRSNGFPGWRWRSLGAREPSMDGFVMFCGWTYEVPLD